MEMSALFAARTYGAARPATAPDPAGTPGRLAADAAHSFAATLAAGEAAATQTLVHGGDPHLLVTALAKAELAVDTVVAVRNRVVEAYLEILRMPV